MLVIVFLYIATKSWILKFIPKLVQGFTPDTSNKNSVSETTKALKIKFWATKQQLRMSHVSLC